MCLSDIDECSEGIVMIGGSGEGAGNGNHDLWCELAACHVYIAISFFKLCS